MRPLKFETENELRAYVQHVLIELGNFAVFESKSSAATLRAVQVCSSEISKAFDANQHLKPIMETPDV